MMLTAEQREAIIAACEVRTSRSGGKGGQNVNKVESRVELVLDVVACSAFSEEQKAMLAEKFGGTLAVASSIHRSQLRNREEAAAKLISKIEGAMVKRAKRYKTRPTRASRVKKRDAKARHSRLKSLRRKPGHDGGH